MLTNEELQNIIDQFDEDELKKEAIFGISIASSDENFIKANKEGLALFALELLKSTRQMEMALSREDHIPLNTDVEWIDKNSDILIEYIEPISSKQPKTEYQTTLTDRIMPFGCGLIILILVVSVVVGFITLLQWLF